MTKPRPILVEMPLLVKRNIANKLNTSTLFSLRRTNKSFHKLLKDHPITYESLVFILQRSRYIQDRIDILLKLDETTTEQKLMFHRDEIGFLLQKLNGWHMLPNSGSTEFINQAVLFLKKILDKKNVTVKNLELDFPHKNLGEFQEQVLKRIKRQFKQSQFQWKVRNFHLKIYGGQDDFMGILPFLEPKTLESISFTSSHWPFGQRPTLQINEIVRLEQWKMAKEVRIKHFRTILSIEECLHLRNIYLYVSKFTLEDLKMVIETVINTNYSVDFYFLSIRISGSLQEYLDATFPEVPNEEFREWNVDVTEKPFKILMGRDTFRFQKIC